MHARGRRVPAPAINFSTDANITNADVLGTWAGLRPLVKEASDGRTADLSRKHSVRRSPSGLVTVTGGKLTTYRRMAADAVDMAEEPFGRTTRSRTKKVRLAGADGWDRGGLSEHLKSCDGALGRDVEAIAAGDRTLREPLVTGAPYSRAEAVYAVREEMATSVDDVLSRRTCARLLARDASAAAADDVAALIGGELGWSDAERATQAATYRAGHRARARRDLATRAGAGREHRRVEPVKTNRGAPTPPIVFPHEHALDDHITTARIELDDAFVGATPRRVRRCRRRPRPSR